MLSKVFRHLSADNFTDLFSKKFYMLSLLSAMVLLMFTYFVVPVAGKFLSIVSFCTFAYMIVEHLLRDLTISEYKTRYAATIYVAVFVNIVSTFFLHKDYMLFVPMILSIMYLNVNSILKSKAVFAVTVVFMLSPLVKILLTKRDLEYTSIIVLFIVSIMLSDVMFRGKAYAIAESERRRELMREVFKLMNNLTVHDVRNVLQKMQTLSLPKYRNDQMVFLEQLEKYTEDIDRLVDTRLFDTLRDVNVRHVLDMLSNVTTSKHIVFSLDDRSLGTQKCNVRMLYATLKNLMENTVEASARLGKISSLHVTLSSHCITLVDDCGGFDVSKITQGHTSKKDKETHGVFLKTILDPALNGIFGFKLHLENIGTGTRATLTFTEIINNTEENNIEHST